MGNRETGHGEEPATKQSQNALTYGRLPRCARNDPFVKLGIH